jgi:hypothetical protein
MFTALLLALGLRARTGYAQVEWGDAARYARRSVSVMATPELSLSPGFTARLLLDATLRVNAWGGFTVQPRVGVGAGGTFPGGGVAVAARFGAGVGGTFTVHRSVALSPMLGYDLFLLGAVGSVTPSLIHRATIELPVTLLLGAHALAELYVQAGLGVVESGALDLGLGGGIRFGLTFSSAPRP